MTKEELGQLYPIVLKPYNPDWRNCFEKERDFLHNLFSLPLRIEHIGSTAIIGLSAKPTIDILMEVPSLIPASVIINKFISNGYIHMQEQTNHLMFVKGYTPTGLDDISYHVHMGPLELDWLWDRVFFRDYMNQQDEYRKEYEILKLALAKKYKNERELYTNSKAAFVMKVTAEAKTVFQ